MTYVKCGAVLLNVALSILFIYCGRKQCCHSIVCGIFFNKPSEKTVPVLPDQNNGCFLQRVVRDAQCCRPTALLCDSEKYCA